jgi:hypothetical protein
MYRKNDFLNIFDDKMSIRTQSTAIHTHYMYLGVCIGDIYCQLLSQKMAKIAKDSDRNIKPWYEVIFHRPKNVKYI